MVSVIDDAVRADRIWIKIQRNPSSIVFTKPKALGKNDPVGSPATGTVLPAQIVRVTNDSQATVVGGSAGVAPKHALVVFGITGHPTQPDNDIDEGYTFPYDGEIYRVNKVKRVPGGMQATATTGGPT